MLKEDFAKAAGLSPALADRWHDPVERAMMEFAIVSPARAAAFIAQCGHESAGFTTAREIWGPTPAQLRYEGRADLGNVHPGDGSRYRGRGLIQITGAGNYAAASIALDVDYLANPEYLERPADAARVSGWWWQAHGCNELADRSDFEMLCAMVIERSGSDMECKRPDDAAMLAALTRRINGGLNGYDDRQRRWEAAKIVLGV